MKKFKQILVIVTLSVMAVVFAPMLSGVNGEVNAEAEGVWYYFDSGHCIYQIKNHTLTIRPDDGYETAYLPGYKDNRWPWAVNAIDCRDGVYKVVFEPGVKAGNRLSHMFYEFKNLESIEFNNFDTSNATEMNYMFYGCKTLKSVDLSGFNTSNVTIMNDMFEECEKLESVKFPSSLDTSKVEDMGYLFCNCYALKSLDLSMFNTSSVKRMAYMFDECKTLKSLDLSSFNTSNVEDMWCMLNECTSLRSLDISNFDTSNCTDMSYMFDECGELRTIYASKKFVTTKVSASTDMFRDCKKLIGGAGTKYNPNWVALDYARIDKDGYPGYFTSDAASITYNTETTYYPTVQKAVNAAQSGRTIKMNSDSTENVTIPSGKTITLDLNGHVLTGIGNGSVITNNGTLTIKDISDTSELAKKTHYFTYNSDAAWEYIPGHKASGKEIGITETGEKALTSGSTIFKLYGGCITGGTGNLDYETSYGGGIYSKGSLTIKGGNIVGNSADSGGAVQCSTTNSKVFNMSGEYCWIVGNAAINRGAIYIRGENCKYSMSGGRIAYNVGTGTNKYSNGGIYFGGNSFTMSNGRIDHNTCGSNGLGGGVYFYSGAFTMSGGTIDYNKAGANSGSGGGGVYVEGGSVLSTTFTMTGGSIEHNSAIGNGGGVYNGGSMKVGGSAVISGNTLQDGTTANNLYLATGKTVTTGTGESGDASAPAEAMDLYVTTQTAPIADTPVAITGTSTADYSSHFKSDSTDYYVFNDSNVVKLGIHSHKWEYTLAKTATDNDTVTAECKGSGPCGYEGTDFTLTIVAPAGVPYDSESHDASFAQTSFCGSTDLPQINYEYKESENGTYANATDTKQAGYYRASFKVGTEASEKTAYVEYYVPAFTVSFDEMGHGTETTAQIISAGGKVAEPTAPSEACYEFEGWFEDEECEVAWDFDNDTINEDTTLYAKWKALDHTLTKTDAKAVKCTVDGNSEYYTCSECEKYFSDAEGKNEIAKDSWISKALGHNYKTKSVGGGCSYKYCTRCNYKTSYTSPSYVKSFKLSKGTKSFTAKWKKQSSSTQKKFTGYRIRYSTKSSMSGAKTVYVKKSASSKTISKLSKKKKYYVEICSYVKKSGKKYYSKVSKASVTTK